MAIKDLIFIIVTMLNDFFQNGTIEGETISLESTLEVRMSLKLYLFLLRVHYIIITVLSLLETSNRSRPAPRIFELEVDYGS